MKIFLLLFCNACVWSACAQQKAAGIKRVDAFYQVQIPGIIPAPEKRRPGGSLFDTAYFVYVQTTGTAVQWERAWTGSRSFAVTAVTVVDSALVVGADNKTGKAITLSKAAAGKRYRLTLAKERTYAMPPGEVKFGTLLLQGNHQGKSFTYPVKNLVELRVQPNQ